MTKTFNRRPMLQSGPSRGDIKNYTFDNYKFTGFKEDKNFLEIDQYSFSECENVYVDADGLLRSRPSIKEYDIFYNNTTYPDLLNIYKVFNKNNIYVINGLYSASPNNKDVFILYDFTNGYCNKIEGTAYAVTSYGDQVFIFAHVTTGDKNIIYKYDKSAGTFAESEPYIPETKVQANGDVTQFESKNVLTDKTKTIYLYTSDSDFLFLNGKVVRYKAFGQTFELTFNDFSKQSIVEELRDTTQSSKEAWYHNGGTFVYFNSKPIPGQTFTVSGGYSFDGKIFKSLPSKTGIFRGFTIADDGINLFLAMDNNIYCCNLNSLIWEQVYNIPGTIRGNSVHLSAISGSDFACCYLYTFQLDSSIIPMIRTIFNGNSLDYNPSNFETYDTSSYSWFKDIGLKYYDVDWLDPGLNQRDRMVIVYGTNNKNFFHDLNSGKHKAYIVVFGGGSTSYAFPSINATEPHGSQTYIDNILDVNYSYKTDKINILRQTAIYVTLLSLDGENPARYYMSETTSFSNPSNFGRIFNDGSTLLIGDLIVKGSSTVSRLKFPPTVFVNTFSVDDYVYSVIGDENYDYKVVTNNITSVIELTEINGTSDSVIEPDQIQELSEYYFRVGNKLYISEYREDSNGDLLWYLPEINTEEFDGFSTMYPLSSTEMGIFTEDGVYIVSKSDDVYLQTKSKISVKIKQGNEILSTYDGTSLIVPTARGLALMSYQDFVQSTDQKLTFLSDTIYDSFGEYNTGSIKLYRYGYWFVIYKQNINKLYLLDIRAGSWWPINIGNRTVKQIIDYNDKPLLLLEDSNVKTYSLNKSVDDYFDYNGDKIDWFLRSQPLYLNAVNYYKHVQNLTFMTHILGESDDGYKVVANLTNTVYRSQVHPDAEAKTWKYDVEMIRSYVLRLNYPKVCEFEYLLESNNIDEYDPVPLSLSNITVKYRLGGQIR